MCVEPLAPAAASIRPEPSGAWMPKPTSLSKRGGRPFFVVATRQYRAPTMNHARLYVPLAERRPVIRFRSK
jgi:hypothetical protein